MVGTVKGGAAKHGFPLPATFGVKSVDPVWIGVVLVSLVLIGWAVWQSKREAQHA